MELYLLIIQRRKNTGQSNFFFNEPISSIKTEEETNLKDTSKGKIIQQNAQSQVYALHQSQSGEVSYLCFLNNGSHPSFCSTKHSSRYKASGKSWLLYTEETGAAEL